MSMAAANERTVKPAAIHPSVSMRLCDSRPGCNSAAVSCSRCRLSHVCLPNGLVQDALLDMDELTRVKRRVLKGATLYRAGDAFESLYAVRSGSFKTLGVSRHGDEKVTALHLPGEVMGLEAINSKRHGYDAIALEDSEVCVIPFGHLSQLSMRIPELQQQLLRILSGDISRDQGLMLLLGGMNAEQRLAAFLLSLSRRYQKLGYASTRFSLRMTREEIGSYLGLTLETVSRLFSRFQKDGLLKAHQKEIELQNVDKLREKVGH
jgi:CRP/FNR family transcriptional regulator, anaerobic regulatory protein